MLQRSGCGEACRAVQPLRGPDGQAAQQPRWRALGLGQTGDVSSIAVYEEGIFSFKVGRITF